MLYTGRTAQQFMCSQTGYKLIYSKQRNVLPKILLHAF
jgi:hypothetical protein